MNRKKKRIYTLLGIGFFLIAIIGTFLFITPEDIVSFIGIENTYLFLFLLASIGGLSAITGTSVFTSIITFVAGGAHPALITLSAGAGIFISDTIFFLLATHGRKALPEEWKKIVYRFTEWTTHVPFPVALVCIYLYISIFPLPNDILMIALALAGYRYRHIAPVILLGSLTIAGLAAYLGTIIPWFS